MTENQILSVDNKLLQDTALRIIHNLLNRKEYMFYDVNTVHGIHYAEVITAFAALRISKILNDDKTLHKLIERYSFELSDTPVNGKIQNTHNHVDVNIFGIISLELYKYTKNRTYLEQGMSLVEGQWADPLENGMSSQSRYWIDDMFMIGFLQLQAYETTADTIYMERAALTVNAYLKKLQQKNGLFYHGEEALFFWGRGNGWCAVAMAQILTFLPDNHKYYTFIKKSYIKMIKTLLEYQGNDGMWKQLIDYESAWSESSCTAMFSYSIAEGLKNGFFGDKEYAHVLHTAFNALINLLDVQGNLENICAGTGQSSDANYYLERPRVTGDLHGQGFMLFLLYSLLKP